MFEPESLLIIAGLILVIIGAIGGGWKVKEISVPQIGRISRTLAIVIGLFLVGISVNMLMGGGDADDYDDVGIGYEEEY